MALLCELFMCIEIEENAQPLILFLCSASDLNELNAPNIA